MVKVDDILKRLRELRKRKALKQDYIAKRLGIDRTTYVRKERGHIPITTREWLLLAEVMSEDPSCFFAPAAGRAGRKGTGKKGAEEEGAAVERLYSLMGPEERRDLMYILLLVSRILENRKLRKTLREMDADV